MPKTPSAKAKGKQVNPPPYDNLPPEVLVVSDRIGLRKGAKVAQVQSLMKETLGEESAESLRFTTYRLKDVQMRLRFLRGQRKFKKISKKSRKKGVKPNNLKKKMQLTAKQRRQLFDLKESKEDLKYETFMGLNQLWKGYFNTVASDCKNPNFDYLKFVRADYHGAMLVVSSAKNPSLVGVEGIVIQETKNTFRLIAQDNRVVTIPKDGTTFSFGACGTVFKLNGSQMCMSSHQRSRAKPKIRAKINVKKDIVI